LGERAHIVPAYGAGEANIAIVQRMELKGAHRREKSRMGAIFTRSN
jgi:hypothetical protein